MILESPFFISSRLLPALQIGDAVLSLDTEYGCTRDDRDIATFYLDRPGLPEYVDRSMKSGCQGFGSTVEVFETYIGFLRACVESRQYGDGQGENADLFPDDIGEWAEDNASDLEYLSCVLMHPDEDRVYKELILE